MATVVSVQRCRRWLYAEPLAVCARIFSARHACFILKDFTLLVRLLASLDDAKKYQSLRDVMSTMNAPDLAAVFEDLPEEKMPVLFRLCPKDLAADVFAELSSETQEALIRGLTDRELKSVVEELCVDDATDLVEEMPANVVKRILAQAEPDPRKIPPAAL